MNDQTPTPDELPELPELSPAAIARIENAVFAEIESDRPATGRSTARSRARRRRWLTGAGVAAAFAVGVLVTPPILGAVGGGGGGVMSTAGGGGVVYDGGGVADTSKGGPPAGTTEIAPGALSDGAVQSAPESGREIVSTANATLEVKDVAKAADAITALAAEHGGYVESTEVGKALAVDGTTMPAPADPGYGWISIRVPSADLTAVMDALADSGEVLSSSVSKQDVTSTAVDLRARVDATKTSVQRLTELVAQSASVSDLIEAEVALTDRQAQLESYEQQLASLEDQVAMSTLQVQLTRPAPQASADPAGFGDGIAAGWNGLIVSLNALVVAVGFILPWLGVATAVVLVIWLVHRARRGARASRTSSDTSVPAPSED